MRFQCFLDGRDVLWERRDLFSQRRGSLIQGLKLDHQMNIWVHENLILARGSTETARRLASRAALRAVSC
jgi:hypothetical protein